MRINTNIGESLKNIRNYFGYTQQEIADQINIKRSLYSNYETNDCLIPLKNLIKLANFYKITVDSLLAFTDLEKSNKDSIKAVQIKLHCLCHERRQTT